MATLVLVRHGQASLGAEDYDVLSSTGWRQGRALGCYWKARGERFDAVHVGPRRRHRETWQAVGEGLQGPSDWPTFDHLAEMDEHQGPEVVGHYHQRLAVEAPTDAAGSTDEVAQRQGYLEAFQRLTRQWVRGELATPEGLEPWSTFRQRVDLALDRLASRRVAGGQQVVFTSGGVVAAAVGRALDLDDEQIMALSWRIRNASFSKFLVSEGRFSLDTFNETPHLGTSDLTTFV